MPRPKREFRLVLTGLSLEILAITKGVGDGVFELRIDCGPGYRVYYGLDNETLVILLCGGTKKQQARTIKMAQTCWKLYKEEKRDARNRP